MTDLRARLADALRENIIHYLTSPMIDFEGIADVLLSLPGVAIVELPERNDKGGWPCGCDGRHVWLDHSGLYVRTLGETYVHNPRAFAAALLAAAAELEAP